MIDTVFHIIFVIFLLITLNYMWFKYYAYKIIKNEFISAILISLVIIIDVSIGINLVLSAT